MTRHHDNTPPASESNERLMFSDLILYILFLLQAAHTALFHTIVLTINFGLPKRFVLQLVPGICGRNHVSLA